MIGRIAALRRSRPSRGGTNLTELLLVVIIGVVLLAAVYKLLISGIIRGEETTEEMKLLVDVRGLLELMSRDISSAHVFLKPSSGDAKSNVAVARYAGEDASDRPKLNTHYATYPFFNDPDKGGTVIKLALNRVQYLFDPDKHQISRVEESGTLQCEPSDPGSSPEADVRLLSKFGFTMSKELSNRVLARNVALFRADYLDYDGKGQARLTSDVPRAACVGISLQAVQRSGVYDRPAGKPITRRQPMVEIATKFWTMRKLSEVRYPEYFSSADDDLRF